MSVQNQDHWNKNPIFTYITFILALIFKMMSNLIILVIQEKKSRSSNGRNKQITIVPKIKFQGENCSQLRRCIITLKSYMTFYQPNYLSIKCAKVHSKCNRSQKLWNRKSIALNMKATVQRIKAKNSVGSIVNLQVFVEWMYIKKMVTERGAWKKLWKWLRQHDTALSFWELFNTRKVTEGLRNIDAGQNDRLLYPIRAKCWVV